MEAHDRFAAKLGYAPEESEPYEEDAYLEEWASEVGDQIDRVEGMLGRELTGSEMRALSEDAVRAEETGETFDAADAFGAHYERSGSMPPDPDSKDGRTALLSEFIEDARHEQGEGEHDEAD